MLLLILEDFTHTTKFIKGGIFMSGNYRCSICGKKHVKLWRPFDGTKLICARCAERKQVHDLQYVYVMKTSSDEKSTIPKKVKVSIPKWKIDENGNIPFYFDSSFGDIVHNKTNSFYVKLNNRQATLLVPAILVAEGVFLGGFISPKNELYRKWQNLPTR